MNEQEILAHIVNLMFKCFDCKVAQIQLVCIEKTYVLCQKVSFNDMKTKLIPRILMLCNDPDVKVKKRALKFVKERIDLLDPSLITSQAFSIIENNLGQNNPASINFLLLDLMEEISKSYDVDVIASKVLPILIGFLANKTSTKEEFDRYHESVLKFINRVKEKRLKEFNSQPFKAKPEEPDDSAIAIQPLDSLVNNAKVEGLDSLFSKQNQMGHGHGVVSPSPTTTPSQTGNVFNFPDLTSGGDMGGNNTMGFTFGNDFNLGTPTTTAPGTDSSKGLSFPKPPEKTTHESNTMGQPATKKPLNFGSLTGLSLGKETNTTSNPPKKSGPSNYSAFDDLVFSGLNTGGGLGSGSQGTSGSMGMMGNTITSYNMGSSGQQDLGGQNKDFGLTFGGGLNNGMGIGGLSINDNSDPFGRGMDGLMMGGMGGFGNGMGKTTGMNTGGMGNTTGSNSGGLGDGFGMTFGKTDLTGNNGFGGGMGGFGSMSGGMGGSNMMGTMGGNTMGSGLMDLNATMNFPQSGGGFNSNMTFGNQPKPQGGILSNPNLTFKAKEPEKKTLNNFNEFDLL